MTTTAFCASCGTARGLGRFCTNCGRAYETEQDGILLRVLAITTAIGLLVVAGWILVNALAPAVAYR